MRRRVGALVKHRCYATLQHLLNEWWVGRIDNGEYKIRVEQALHSSMSSRCAEFDAGQKPAPCMQPCGEAPCVAVSYIGQAAAQDTDTANPKGSPASVASLRAVVDHLGRLTTKDEAWAYLTSDDFTRALQGHYIESSAPSAREATFAPLEMVEWLQRWWKRDATWRNQQRAMLGQDVAQLMRGVADMLEQPCEGSDAT